MKVRIESSASHSHKKTGVGYYAKRLTYALRQTECTDVVESQFNFRGRQLPNGSSVESINFPQKIYAKLDYFNLAFPFDISLKPADVTIFPNYALWPCVRTRKRAVTIHDLSFLKYPEVVETKNLAYLQKIVPRAVKQSDLILTPSETVKQDLVFQYGVAAEKVHVTHIPPTEEYFKTSDRPVRDIYKIPTKGYILFASTIEPRKNLDVVLEAYTRLPEELREKYSLVIAGGMGWKSEETREKLTKLQATYPNIVTTGYYDQADAAALYQQASVFVMPSHYEGFGMPLLEAMASRTPTIASDIPVFHEVCGEASLFFAPEDATALATHLTTVLNDQEVCDELVTKGNVNLERFSWDIVASELVKRLEVML